MRKLHHFRHLPGEQPIAIEHNIQDEPRARGAKELPVIAAYRGDDLPGPLREMSLDSLEGPHRLGARYGLELVNRFGWRGEAARIVCPGLLGVVRGVVRDGVSV